MARATKVQKAQLLNAAYHLLAREIDVAGAARQLEQEFGLSRRQAYRYLEHAAELQGPVPAIEPTVAITFKLPISVVRTLRAYAQRSGLTLGQIVAQALTSFFGAVRGRRG